MDAHFQDEAGSMSLLFLPLKAANTSFIDIYSQLPLRLPMMQTQKSLTLRWLSISQWGSDHVSPCFVCKGGQYVGYA